MGLTPLGYSPFGAFGHFLAMRQTHKVVLVGPTRAGKTSLCSRWILGEFPEVVMPTLGANYSCYTQGDTELQLWDTAGQEVYRSLVPVYLRNSDCAVVVIDGTTAADLSADSLHRLKCDVVYWVSLVQEASPDVLIRVVVNKVDLIPKETERALLDALGIFTVCATSAKTGQGTEDAIAEMIAAIREAYRQRQAPKAKGQRLAPGGGVCISTPEANSKKCC